MKPLRVGTTLLATAPERSIGSFNLTPLPVQIIVNHVVKYQESSLYATLGALSDQSQDIDCKT